MQKKESFGTHLFASPVLLSLDFQFFQNLASYIHFSFDEDPETEREFKVELLYFDMLFTDFIFKNTFLFHVA